MPKNGNNALDRLMNMIDSSEEDKPTASISSEDFCNDVENDIMSKMGLFDDSDKECRIKEIRLNDESSEESEVKNKSKQSDRISKSVEAIPIDVTDTGEDIPFDSTINALSEPVKNKIVNSNNEEELFNNNTVIEETKPEGKKRGRKKKHVEVIPTAVEEPVADDSYTNPLYNQLVLNMINELEKSKFKLSEFSDESMNILFEYIKTKF